MKKSINQTLESVKANLSSIFSKEDVITLLENLEEEKADLTRFIEVLKGNFKSEVENCDAEEYIGDVKFQMSYNEVSIDTACFDSSNMLELLSDAIDTALIDSQDN